MNKVNTGLEAVLNIYYDYVGCSKCTLCENRPTKDILGSFGSASSDIMIITDAPTAEDFNNKGLLTDDNGRLLMNMLEIIWDEEDLHMDKIRDYSGDYYWNAVREYLADKLFFAAVVACPPLEGVSVTKLQAETCRTRLYELIYAIDPIIVVALGSVAGSYILKTSGKVAKNRGMVFDFSIPSMYSDREIRYPGLITYHPDVLNKVGDQYLVEKKQGLTYDCMQDFRKVFNIVKKHKELLCQ